MINKNMEKEKFLKEICATVLQCLIIGGIITISVVGITSLNSNKEITEEEVLTEDIIHSCKEFNFKGHSYLLLITKYSGKYSEVVVHNPDCKCNKKIEQ